MHGLKRIFYSGTLSGVIELPEDDARRLKTVLRAQNGDRVELLSETSLAEGVISSVGKNTVLVRVDAVRDAVRPEYDFTVYQCLAKREYMDVIVEKYAELGVTKIVPIISARSLNSLKDSALARFKVIARDAVLQSENEFIPEITEAKDISKIKAEHESCLLFHERCGEKAFPCDISKNVGIIIGPEGGFTEKETIMLHEKGFKAYTPLSCILKAETAAVLFAGMVRVALS